MARFPLWIPLLLLLATFGASAPSSAQARFDALPVLPGEEAEAFASGVSGDGSVVVGSSRVRERPRAVRWTEEDGELRIARLSRRYGHAVSASHDGSSIVGSVGRNVRDHPSLPFPEVTFRAIRWRGTRGHPMPRGKGESVATDVSGDGSAACGTSGSHAVIWTRGRKARRLGSLPGGDGTTRAEGISDDGRVVVGYAGVTDTEAFRWTEETGLVGLGTLPGGAFSKAQAVSADGSVVVGSSDTGMGWEAFVWTEADGMVGLGDLPGGEFLSFASAVSGDGSRVVGVGVGADSQFETFLWDATQGMRRLADALTEEFGLDLAGWEIESVAGLSDDGTVIVGTGIELENGTYRRKAWRAVIPAL